MNRAEDAAKKRAQRDSIVYRSEFRPYVLRAWDGSRYLDFFQVDPVERTITEIWLGHVKAESGRQARRTSITVATFREPDRKHVVGTDDPARAGLLKLLNGSVPSGTDLPEGFWQAVVNYADRQSMASVSWPTWPVVIDGSETFMRYHIFADGYTGYCQAPDTRGPIIIVAYGSAVEDLNIESRTSLIDYDVDLEAGFKFLDMKPHTEPLPYLHQDFVEMLSEA